MIAKYRSGVVPSRKAKGDTDVQDLARRVIQKYRTKDYNFESAEATWELIACQ
jgi:hypothetical protein